MRRCVSLFAATILCFAIVTAGTLPAHALSGLTLSPPLRDITLGPGLLEANADITLQNNTGQAVRASLQLVDLKALGQYGGNSLGQAGLPDKYGLANWMSLPGGNTLVIADKQTVNVHVVIANRSDLAPGGHYGAVIISVSSAASGPVAGTVSLNQQLISLVFVKKLGGEVYGLQLQASEFSKSSGVPQTVATTLQNTGNVHVVPRGFITVTDPAGVVVSKGIINIDSSIILPGSSRKFETLMQPVANSSRQGRYTVTTYYRYDGQQNFSHYSQSYNRGGLVFTRYVAAGVIGAVVLAVGSVLLILKKRRHKRTNQSPL